MLFCINISKNYKSEHILFAVCISNKKLKNIKNQLRKSYYFTFDLCDLEIFPNK